MKNGVFKEDGKYVAYRDDVKVGEGLYRYQADKALHNDASKVAQEAAISSIPINKRFGFVTSLVKMVARRETPSMILVGEGGLGKSHTVEAALREMGYTDSALGEAPGSKRYTLVKGYTTPKGLFRTLYENQNGLLVFDDCDSALDNDDAALLFKAALDSNDKRIVSWNVSREDDLPRSFPFTGGAIFISNRPLSKIDQAIRTRSMVVDLAMTMDQKIERMTLIAESPDFVPSVSIEVKRHALELINKHKTTAAEISLRSLIKVAKILNSEERNVELAEYALQQG